MEKGWQVHFLDLKDNFGNLLRCSLGFWLFVQSEIVLTFSLFVFFNFFFFYDLLLKF